MFLQIRCVGKYLYTVDIKGLHSPVKTAGFHHVQNETKINHVINVHTAEHIA